MNKKIVSGEILEEKMIEAVNLLCDTVSSTLGPSGNNVIINNSDLTPFITNDGVTIAESIESEDVVINTILSLAKEASIKTNEVVGDGTTTTLVLLKSIFNEGMKLIKNGYNRIELKNEINSVTNDIIDKLTNMKRNLNKNEIIDIASVSCGNEEYGKIIGDLFNKTKNIKINISGNKIEAKVLKGYSLDNGVSSNFFMKNNDDLILNNPYILISNNEILDLEMIAKILNDVSAESKSLLIIAPDFAEEVINELVLENNQKFLNVVAVKSPDYGIRQYEILKDIAVLSNGIIFNNVAGINLCNASLSDLGRVNKVITNKNETIIINDFNNKSYIKELKNELLKETDEYKKEFINLRIAKLNKGIGIINIATSTKTESKELKMRFDDAVCALTFSSEGVVPGGGISLLSLQNNFNNISLGKQVVINALDKPFKQIINNVGLNEMKILANIKETNYHKLYNVKTNKYDDILNTKILDPYLVVKNSLLNASSIASMLLTTRFLVINEHIKDNNIDFNKEI